MTTDPTRPTNVSRTAEHDEWSHRLWDRPYVELSPCQVAVVIRAADGGFPAATTPSPEPPPPAQPPPAADAQALTRTVRHFLLAPAPPRARLVTGPVPPALTTSDTC